MCIVKKLILDFMIKKFSFPQKIWFEPMFLTGSLAVFIGAAPPRFLNFAGEFPRRRRRRKPFELSLTEISHMNIHNR